jgi:hypothetical protein
VALHAIRIGSRRAALMVSVGGQQDRVTIRCKADGE